MQQSIVEKRLQELEGIEEGLGVLDVLATGPVDGAGSSGGLGQASHQLVQVGRVLARNEDALGVGAVHQDRKSTRLNSSHVSISYAVFCLKKKITTNRTTI